MSTVFSFHAASPGQGKKPSALRWRFCGAQLRGCQGAVLWTACGSGEQCCCCLLAHHS